MEPYAWAFCMSAYDAPSADAAEAVTIARRDQPRTGCNNFPFTRMKGTGSVGAAGLQSGVMSSRR